MFYSSNPQPTESGRPDSNRRRPAWEAGILPTELRPQTDRREPPVGIEPTTARLRIECSTTELLWRDDHALARTRTATPFGTTPSRWRVYQFHHQGDAPAADPAGDAGREGETRLSCGSITCTTGATGLEPATSRVTVECSNQTELRPQQRSNGGTIETSNGTSQ